MTALVSTAPCLLPSTKVQDKRLGSRDPRSLGWISGGRWEEPRPGVGPLGDAWTGRQLLTRAAPSHTRTAGAYAYVCQVSPRHTNVEPRAAGLHMSLEEEHPLRKNPQGGL